MPKSTGKNSTKDTTTHTDDNLSNTEYEESDYADIEWNGKTITAEQYEAKMSQLVSTFTANDSKFDKITDGLTGIFGMPYQFSKLVDPILENSNGSEITQQLGRKFNEKVYSVMPVLFLTPGEPRFMDGYGKSTKQKMMNKLINTTLLSGDKDGSTDIDDGRYYSFTSNFQEYKKYANVALRALAIFMGIGEVEVPVPGKKTFVKLKNIDVEKFMNNGFTKLFGSNCVLPFFVDAVYESEEGYSNSTTQSSIAQSVNSYSDQANEIRFMAGSAGSKGFMKNAVTAATNVADSIGEALTDVADALAGKSLATQIVNSLTTIATGGKISFPEIWSDSDYDGGSYTVNLKLRSPDPDPVSIYLNIYMPIILLIAMAAPHQVGNSSNMYESPFLVRATYKSIFSCDLGLITALRITKGGEANWNALGQPFTADVSIEIKDLYNTMFISKRMGLICNTAQMDYLATLAGLDLNDYSATRSIRLFMQILGDTPRDWTSDMWGGIKRTLNRKAASILSKVSDTRFLS